MLKTALRSLAVLPMALALSTAVASSAHGQTSCPNGAYTNTAGNRVCSPFPSSQVPAGATALCNDGEWSFSQSRSGTCSSHGGVNFFLADVAPAVAAPVTTAPVAAMPVATTSGDLQGSRILSFSAGTTASAATAPRVAATRSLPTTGLHETHQLVEFALVLIGLGTALVIARRPGVIR